MLPSIKLGGPRVQIFCIEKDSTYGQQITCEYLEMMLFYNSETKKIPPPQKKGAGIRTVAIWLHAHVFVCDLDFYQVDIE